ncbi:hypothetical protein H5410_043939 [Solanum commersonii]|uniref:Uncharacterized protein n=1 Tax=Solanum commersonii TaxID=4109 RepID=A0A9J5XZ05_SOLCO|nr:hypothetical protein H5410_043939 [Solanum commersonii]
MKEEILETKVKERVGNRKMLVIYGLTFHFKVGPNEHLIKPKTICETDGKHQFLHWKEPNHCKNQKRGSTLLQYRAPPKKKHMLVFSLLIDELRWILINSQLEIKESQDFTGILNRISVIISVGN